MAATGGSEVFERQVCGLDRPGDVLIGISTSGRSGNIMRAIQVARELGIYAAHVICGIVEERLFPR